MGERFADDKKDDSKAIIIVYIIHTHTRTYTCF